jgi:hypothetical protein
MRFRPELAYELLTRVDPGRLRAGKAIGLRDGALLALVAAGLTGLEITNLLASAVTMDGGQVQISVHRQGITWSAPLPTELGARLLAWLTECRLWGEAEPLFRGRRGPITQMAISRVLDRSRKRQPAPSRRTKRKSRPHRKPDRKHQKPCNRLEVPAHEHA